MGGPPGRHIKRKLRNMAYNPKRVLRKFDHTASRVGRIADTALKVSNILGGQGLYEGGMMDYAPGQRAKGFGSYMLGEGAYEGDTVGNSYVVNNNALIRGGGVPDIVPNFGSNEDETGAITIIRSEYISDIYCSGYINPGSAGPPLVPPFPTGVVPFSVKRYDINPGLPETFPWLSQIAQNYDEYEIEQLIFSFSTAVSDIGASATGQCGNVLMVGDYNVDSPNFRSKEDLMMYQGAVSTKTTESACCAIECNPKKNAGSPGKFTRTAGLPLNKNKFDYDLGTLNVAVSAAPVAYAGQSLGELWVSYRVKLRKPKFYANKAYGVQQDIFVTSQGTISPSFPMGSNALLLKSPQNTIKAALGLEVANSIFVTFPASYSGQVEVSLNIEAGTAYYGYDANTQRGYLNEFKSFGNIKPIYDIYGTGFQVATASSKAQWYYISPKEGTGNFVAICHLTVEAASNGIENTLQIIFDPSRVAFSAPPASFQQSQLTIKEYNTSWSGKANNIGSDIQNEAPVLVNTSAVVFVPGVSAPTIQS